MVKDALVSQLDLFRPYKQTDTSGKITYRKVSIFNVKLNQNSSAWVTDTTGAVQSKSATLFYNNGISSHSSLLSPLFQAGDIVCETTDDKEPPIDRLVVRNVTEHTFKGALHHIEVVLA